MIYRETTSFGKRAEYSVISELLKRNFDVYLTLVDDRGIDCIVRLDNERYLDIQIKARSRHAKRWYFFPALEFEPKKKFYFIFYTEKSDKFWVIPSKDVFKLGRKIRSGKNAGKISISLPRSENGEKWRRFEKYLDDNGFNLLEQFR